MPASGMRNALPDDFQAFARDPKHRGMARVALQGDEPVAIAACAHNLLHPHPRHFEYLMAGDSNAAALTPLLQALLAATSVNEGPVPLHLSLQQTDREAIGWAESQGFVPIMTTYHGTLPPMQTRFTKGAALRRLADRDSPALRDALAVVHAQVYRHQHDWNPPAHIDPAMAEGLFLDEHDLLPEAMWYAPDTWNRPTGVSSLRKTRHPEVVELGWVGVLPGVDQSVLLGLIGAALNATGPRALNVEVDRNQSVLLAVLQALPVVWRESVIRYELRIPHD